MCAFAHLQDRMWSEVDEEILSTPRLQSTKQAASRRVSSDTTSLLSLCAHKGN